LRAPFLVGTAVGFALCAHGQTNDGSLAASGTNSETRVDLATTRGTVEPDRQVKELQEAAALLQLQLEETKIAFRKVLGDNAELKLQASEKEKTLQLLTQSLTVWKTEAELFQQKYEEAQLAARASGVKLMTEGEKRLQKQLAESIRQLYEAQQDREKLREQMQRLIEATGVLLEKSDGVDPAARRLVEAEKNDAVQALQSLKPEVETSTTNRVESADTGKVLDFNKELQLVVINLGRVNGVRIGMPFLVLQGDAVAAHVKVVDVREKISGALIETWDRSAAIQVGDRVKLNTDGK